MPKIHNSGFGISVDAKKMNPKKGGQYDKHHQKGKCSTGNFWKCC